jgi:hypothetical protein
MPKDFHYRRPARNVNSQVSMALPGCSVSTLRSDCWGVRRGHIYVQKLSQGIHTNNKAHRPRTSVRIAIGIHTIDLPRIGQVATGKASLLRFTNLRFSSSFCTVEFRYRSSYVIFSILPPWCDPLQSERRVETEHPGRAIVGQPHKRNIPALPHQ